MEMRKKEVRIEKEKEIARGKKSREKKERKAAHAANFP